VRIGIIGLGGMGRHHARVIGEIDFVEDVIGCDVDPAARERAAADGIRSVESMDALLAGRPDAVFVVTAPAHHAECIRPWLAAGVPVFTEKPLAASLEEGRELVELARRTGVSFQVGFELRYCGMTRAMRDVFDSGLIGRPRHARLIQVSGCHATRGRMTRERTGGIFYEKLCHQVDLFRHWFGEPRRIMAHAPPVVLAHYTVPENVNACVLFADDRAGHITFTATRAAHVGGDSDYPDRGHYYELTVTGETGAVVYHAWREWVDVIRFNHRDDCRTELAERIDVRARYGEPVYDLVSQDRDFLDAVRAGRDPTFPAADALRTMEWVDLAERSLAADGAWLPRGSRA